MTEPDVRFTFANERTFLAWSRTSLGLVVGGLALSQLFPRLPGLPWARHVIGMALALLGASVAVISYLEWQGNQRAMRAGAPLRRSRLPLILASAVAGIALLTAALALVSTFGVHGRT